MNLYSVSIVFEASMLKAVKTEGPQLRLQRPGWLHECEKRSCCLRPGTKYIAASTTGIAVMVCVSLLICASLTLEHVLGK